MTIDVFSMGSVAVKSTALRLLLVLLTMAGLAPVAFGQGWDSCGSYEQYLHWAGRLGLDGYARDIVVRGNYAYVISDYYYLNVIDVANPEKPAKITTMGSYSYPRAIEANETHLFVANENGVAIRSLTDPRNPIQVGWIDLQSARDIALSGNRAYVTRGSYGVSVVDIADPANPVLLGTVDTPGDATRIAADGTFAYVADGSQGLQVVDASNAGSPVIVGWLPMASTSQCIAREGHVLAVGGQYSVQFVDVTNPDTPELMSSLAMAGSVLDVAMSAGRVWLAGGGGGLVTLDVANPHYPTVIGRISTFSTPYGIDVVGHDVYVADYNAGLTIITSLADLSAPVVARWQSGASPSRVVAQAGQAYLTMSDGSFRSVNCADTANPVEGSRLETGTAQTQCALGAQRAYLCVPYGRLQVVDISNPSQMQFMGALTMGDIREVAVQGDLAFAAAANGLKIVDVADPQAPTLLAELSSVASSHVAVAGKVVVTANGDQLRIVSINNPAQPQVLGLVSCGGTIEDIEISGNQVVAAIGSYGVVVVDISVPNFPLLLSTIDTPGYAYSVARSGDNVVVGDSSAGTLVIDVSNAALPRLTGSFCDAGGARDVALQADYIFAANTDLSLTIMRAPCPSLNLVTVGGSIGALRDFGNTAGVRLDATAGFDVDLESLSPPPAPGEYLSVGFYHPEWNVPLGDGFNADLRPPYDLNNESQVWPLRVETNKSGEVVLEFTPNFGSSTGWGPWLRDMTSGMIVTLGPELTYAYESTGADGEPDIRDFELVMGGQYGLPPLTPDHRDIATGWSLVGMPLTPSAGHQTWGDVLLNDTSGLVYLFSYNVNGTYEPRQGYDTISTTGGIWVGAVNPFTWTMDGMPAVSGVSAPLHRGWNMLGYPLWIGSDVSGIRVDYNGSRYTWADAVAQGLVAGSLFDYDNTTRSYVTVTGLSTWHGYWLAAYQDNVSLWFDYRNAVANAQRAVPAGADKASGDWSLRLAAKNSAAAVTLGVDSHATATFDAQFDLPIPPASPGAKSTDVSLVINHADWNTGTGTGFLSDFISRGVSVYTWEVKMVARGAASVELTWDPTALAVTGDFEIIVPSTGQILTPSLRNASSCLVPLTSGRQTIEVRLNAQASPVAAVPAATSLGANYPNPFNPSTTIACDLAAPSRVSLQVFDASGRLVRVLAAGQDLPAGHHELTWNGRDDAGRAVAGGVYFYRLEAGDYRETRKMMLVK